VILEATVAGNSYAVEVRRKNGRYQILLDGRALDVDLREVGRDFQSLLIDGKSYDVGFEKRSGGFRVVMRDGSVIVELAESTRDAGALAKRTAAGPARVTAPMPGKIVRVLIEAGENVEAGQGLLVMEAMKMENELRSPRAGRIGSLAVREGQAVETGALLAVVE
jgi:biotin carboxyl carrier protein